MLVFHTTNERSVSLIWLKFHLRRDLPSVSDEGRERKTCCAAQDGPVYLDMVTVIEGMDCSPVVCLFGQCKHLSWVCWSDETALCLWSALCLWRIVHRAGIWSECCSAIRPFPYLEQKLISVQVCIGQRSETE